MSASRWPKRSPIILLNGVVRNAVNLPNLDAKTYALVKPYLALGEKLGRLVAQLAPKRNDRLVITYGGKATEVPGDPITRFVLKGFLESAGGKDVNQVNVRTLAQSLGLRVEEIKSNEETDFNEWLHLAVYSGDQKISAGGSLYGARRQPRIVRVNSQPVEIVPEGVLFFMTNKDRPGHGGLSGRADGPAQRKHCQHEPEPRYCRRPRPDGVEPGQRAARGRAGRSAEGPGHQRCAGRETMTGTGDGKNMKLNH